LTFESVYSFFNNNQKPVFKNIQENQSLLSISGRVVTLGENLPMYKDTVLLYEFDAQKGERKTNKPTILLTDLNGFWPSTLVSKNSFLEFELHSKKSRVIRYYVEPQQSNNHLMYLRTIPTSGLVSGLMRAVPKNDSTVALAIFSSNHAIIYGRDSLTIDTVNLSTATLSPAKKTIAASFVFDDGDGKTSKTNVKGFGIGMFLSATDYYIKPSNTEKSAIYFNGKRILVPRIPSKDAVMVIMFN